VKERIRNAVPPGVLEAFRRLSRLRFAAKVGTLRRYEFDVRAHPWQAAKYVLLDPEVGDFSYELRNEEQLGRELAAALGLDPEVVLARFQETRTSQALTTDLAAKVRPRILDMKRRPSFGPRIGWYAMVRELKPKVVVETGIRHGFGSLIILEALRRNAEEGHEGRLLSADLDPHSGWVVPDDLAVRWDRLIGKADEVVGPALKPGEAIDILIHDTPPLPEIEGAEYATALAHRNGRQVLVSGSNGDQTGILPRIAQEHGTQYHLIREVPDHVYPGQGIGLAVIGD
jgi:hypothetical protein